MIDLKDYLLENKGDDIEEQWINDEKAVMTHDGRQVIITKIDYDQVPNIIHGKVKWNDLDNNFIKETKSVEEIKELANYYTLGLTGDDYKHIDEVKDMPNRHEMMQYIKLFCRVSPTQKDDIIKDLIKSGKNPSMCGDGSNDVGALKRATIGVAVLNIEETESQKKEPFNFLSFGGGGLSSI